MNSKVYLFTFGVFSSSNSVTLFPLQSLPAGREGLVWGQGRGEGGGGRGGYLSNQTAVMDGVQSQFPILTQYKVFFPVCSLFRFDLPTQLCEYIIFIQYIKKCVKILSQRRSFNGCFSRLKDYYRDSVCTQ
jgi:hypothetical protein